MNFNGIFCGRLNSSTAFFSSSVDLGSKCLHNFIKSRVCIHQFYQFIFNCCPFCCIITKLPFPAVVPAFLWEDKLPPWLPAMPLMHPHKAAMEPPPVPGFHWQFHQQMHFSCIFTNLLSAVFTASIQCFVCKRPQFRPHVLMAIFTPFHSPMLRFVFAKNICRHPAFLFPTSLFIWMPVKIP